MWNTPRCALDAGWRRWHTARRGRCLRCWLWCCGPPVRAADSFKAALTHPRQLAGYAVPLLAAGVLAWFVRTALARPFVLRVEVGGQVVGYVTDEQAFDAARADVQARLTGRGRLERPTRVHPCHGRRRHPPHDRARDRRCHPARRRRRDHRGYRRLSGRRAAVRHRRGRPPAAVFVRRACAVADRSVCRPTLSTPCGWWTASTLPRPSHRTAT